MKKGFAVTAIGSLLILLFAYTGVSKLLTQPLFKATLSQMPLIAPGAAFLAWWVPLSELVIVLLLFYPRTRFVGLYGSLSLLCLFTAYLLVTLVRGDGARCSCGGFIGNLGPWEHVGLNGAFICLATLGIRLESVDKAKQTTTGKTQTKTIANT